LLTAKDIVRALISNWGDLFWIVVGSIFFTILVLRVAIDMPEFSTMSEAAQLNYIFATTVTSSSVFLSIFLLIRPRSAFCSNDQTRSYAIAVFCGTTLLAVKWSLNYVFSENAAYAVHRQNTWIILLVCLIVPIVEEAFFRGLAWNELRRRSFSEFGVLGATSLLFTLTHSPADISGFVQILCMGLGLGLVRLYSGTIWAGVLIHSLMNIIVMFDL